MKTTHRTLRCPLAPEELEAKHDQLAVEVRHGRDLELTLGALLEAHKYARERAKAEISSSTSVQRSLAKDIESRSEERPVECRILYFFDGDVILLERADTGAFLEPRRMTEDDRQIGIAEKIVDLPKAQRANVLAFLKKHGELAEEGQ